MTAQAPDPITKRRWQQQAAAIGAAIVLAFAAGHLTGQADAPTTSQAKPKATTLAHSQPSAVDIGFSQDMAIHHDQAILMANLAQTRAGPAVKAIADAILLSQSVQIGTMRGWLQLWGEPAAATTPMQWMPGHHTPAAHNNNKEAQQHHSYASAMAGMASPKELIELWRLSGDAFDIRFLQLMTRHHEGGIAMARHAAENGKLEPLREIAEVMVVEQVKDISQMQRLLEGHGAELLPFP